MGRDTSRTAVKTYVPAYQKEEWQRHADRLDMSRSEFVRTMVQVGRRDFSVPAGGTIEETTSEGTTATGTTDEADDASDELEERVVAVLDDGDPRSWEELLAAVTADVEDRLEEALQRLQADNRVQYSGRDGGYRLVSDE